MLLPIGDNKDIREEEEEEEEEEEDGATEEEEVRSRSSLFPM